MTLFIALLRGINVGGNKMVAMSDLRDLVSKLGFEDAKTLLQSGNLLFRGRTTSNAKLEALLEAEVMKRLKIETAFFIRTPDDWQAIIKRNPFPVETKRDPARVAVMFLKSAPDKKDVEALQAAITGPEILRADGSHLYIVYPEGMGRSRLTGALIEKKLRTRGTARNWNTIVKLQALAES